MKKHAATHRLVPGDGTFPVERTSSKALKASSAAYVAKLPAVRQWLIEVAQRRGTVTYAEVRAPFGLRTLEHSLLGDYRNVAPTASTAARVALATSSRKALRSGEGVTSGTGAARS